MYLDVVKASKLYKTSSRKRRIDVMASAVIGNAGLAVQKAYQVDDIPSGDSDDAENVVHVSNVDKKSSETEDHTESSDGNVARSGNGSKMPQDHKSAPNDAMKTRTPENGHDDSDSGADGTEKVEDGGSVDDKSSDSGVATPSEPAPSKPTPSDTVESASGMSLPSTDVTDNLDLEVEDIMGILNASGDTSGVIRTRCKEDELWVYYSDDVNLNDVMVPAIEMMNRPGYTYLEFNRLARSDNAIVFVILKEDTERDKKPESFASDKSEGVDGGGK